MTVNNFIQEMMSKVDSYVVAQERSQHRMPVAGAHLL